MKKIGVFAVLAASMLLSTTILPAEPMKGRLSLGYTDTSGNTDEQKMNFDFNLKEKKNEKLNLFYDGFVYYGKSSGQVNSDKKMVGVMGEFVKDGIDSMYVDTGLLKDRFAGFETRMNLGVGFFKTVCSSNQRNLKASAGIDVTREDYTDSTSNTRKWLRFTLKGDRLLDKNIRLLGSFDLGAPNSAWDERYEIDFSIGSLFTVNSKFDFETKYVSNYRKTPLVLGKEKTDSTFMSSLVYKM